jgi:hypothetical protein
MSVVGPWKWGRNRTENPPIAYGNPRPACFQVSAEGRARGGDQGLGDVARSRRAPAPFRAVAAAGSEDQRLMRTGTRAGIAR